jgi:hypothetical protein
VEEERLRLGSGFAMASVDPSRSFVRDVKRVIIKVIFVWPLGRRSRRHGLTLIDLVSEDSCASAWALFALFALLFSVFVRLFLDQIYRASVLFRVEDSRDV